MTWEIKVVRIQGDDHVGYKDGESWILLPEVEVWRSLTKNQRLALKAACTENILLYAHPRTVKALERRGLVVGVAHVSSAAALTDSGRRLGEWVVRS
jgi:hypothetical protein